MKDVTRTPCELKKPAKTDFLEGHSLNCEFVRRLVKM